MNYGKHHGRGSRWGLLIAGVAVGAGSLGSVVAQTHPATVPDAQVESNVLKALASDQRLAKTTIKSTTVYGTVTLSGNVADEATRTEAENIVSRTAGVLKVVDELTLGSATADAGPAPAAAPEQGTNPNLQSDGTLAPTPPTSQTAQSTADRDLWGPAGPPPDAGSQAQQSAPSQSGPAAQAGGQPYSQPYPPQYGNPSGNQPNAAQAYPPQNYPQQGYPNQNYPAQNGQAPYGAPQPNYGSQGAYGPPPASPYGPGPNYGPPQQGAYAQQRNPNYPGQAGGQIVNVPGGALLRVRLNRGVDSRTAQPGNTFDGVVVSDVVASGAIAIPRGATVQGVVVDAEKAGALKGHGELQLRLTQVTLGGSVYPLNSEIWGRQGSDKTVRTVDSAIGLGAVGAVLGAVAGGGAGAAIGAGVGGAVGVGSSAASGGGQVGVPPEGVIDFHLAAPVQVATLSQAELDRLGYAVPAGAPRGMARRYPGPYYGPAYYGPGYYYGPRYYSPYYRYPY